MTRPGWNFTGFQQQIDQTDRIPEYDPRSGDHLWIFTCAFRWGGPTVETPHLDAETLLTIAGPVCFYCEQEWTPLLHKRRCKGEPRGN